MMMLSFRWYLLLAVTSIGLCLPFTAIAKEALPKPIQVYQKRLEACGHYALATNVPENTFFMPKRPGFFHRLKDGYRCYRLQQDFSALRKQYEHDAAAKGTLDAMQHMVSTIGAACQRR
jgi:hypothetical protein